MFYVQKTNSPRHFEFIRRGFEDVNHYKKRHWLKKKKICMLPPLNQHKTYLYEEKKRMHGLYKLPRFFTIEGNKKSLRKHQFESAIDFWIIL